MCRVVNHELDDPLRFPWRYSRPEDQEIVAFLASSFAFGNVQAMLGALETLFDYLPEHLADALRYGQIEVPRGFRYRYVREDHVQELFDGLTRVLRRWETFGNLVKYLWREAPPLEHPERLRWVMKGVWQTLAPSSNPLLADPTRGSALKRWCLFFRWMVRPSPPDLGLWTFIPPCALCTPLDVHIYRLARRLGWTSRNTADWKTVLEVTKHLQRLFPNDPVGQDFSWYMEERRGRFSKG